MSDLLAQLSRLQNAPAIYLARNIDYKLLYFIRGKTRAEGVKCAVIAGNHTNIDISDNLLQGIAIELKTRSPFLPLVDLKIKPNFVVLEHGRIIQTPFLPKIRIPVEFKIINLFSNNNELGLQIEEKEWWEL